MVRPAQTARSERTREALRRAAVVRFLAQGVEDTSAEQIAADAGVSLRTFYRHFASKHDLLFADYDAGLHWFRAALAAECDQDLAARLAIDAPLFQEQGRRGLTSEQLERLSASYSALPGTMAAEVVAWLAVTGTGHL